MKTMLLLAVLLCAASPTAAQETRNPRGHNDVDDVRSVLRMIVVYQMRHHAEHGRYASSLQELGLPSPDSVSVGITTSGAAGFAAVSASLTEECAIFLGRIAAPRSYVSRAGELACRASPSRSP